MTIALSNSALKLCRKGKVDRTTQPADHFAIKCWIDRSLPAKENYRTSVTSDPIKWDDKALKDLADDMFQSIYVF